MFLCLAALIPFSAASGAQAAGPQFLKANLPPEAAAAPPAGALPDSTPLHLAIGLPLRNQAALQTLLSGLYDPHSPLYRRFLTPEQFAAEFGPAAGDYQAVLEFVRSRGLEVEKTYSSRMLVDVAGTAQGVGRVFHVGFHYRRRPDGSLFYAPDAQPSVDLSVPLGHVSGLDNYRRPWSKMRKSPGSRAKGGTGSGGLYQGGDFRDLYLPGAPATLNGAGQTVALVEFGGFYPSDIAYYQGSSSPAFSAPAPLTVLCDGFSGTPGTSSSDLGDNDEVSLDIEMVNAMAPGAQVLVFEGPDTGRLNQVQYDTAADDIFTAIAAHPECREISCSWGGFGDSTTAAALTQMAVQGQGYYEASGDNGAFVSCNTIGSDPSLYQSPYETLVGGTSVGSTNRPPVWSSETTWNDSLGAGSGGICTNLLSIPSYQSSVPMGANGGSTRWRNLPDVSMAASNLLFVAENYASGHGYAGAGEGTSFASPLWAAFAALAEQQAESQGKGPIGFANATFYSIGLGSGYSNDFHDVFDSSNNDWCSSSAGYTAVGGFDLATGWGSPKGESLINDMVAAVPTATPTPPPTSTPTVTPTPTITFTPTITSTPTVTPTPAPGFSVQVRPNFSTGGTPIRFLVNLPSPDRIRLDVYNMAGELVYADSPDGAQGMNTLVWDFQAGSNGNLASGVYIFHLQAGDGSGGRTKTGKLLILH